MVKKKKIQINKKKSKASKDTFTRLKSIFYGACFVVVAICCCLFSYEELAPIIEKFTSGVEVIGKNKETSKVVENSLPNKEMQGQKNDKKNSSKKKAAKSVKLPDGAELPLCVSKRTEQIIQHKGYTVSYNSDYRVANWVAYELTREEVQNDKVERKNKFVIDPDVKGATAINEDYTGTGYDRGHLAPAADMKWSLQAMQESFYLSNITPQRPKLNRGIWKDLEEQCRLWALDNGALLIATGPVLKPELKRMGKNRVAIPKQFYKVVCMIRNNQYEAVGFLFDNRDYGSMPLQKMMIPVDSVESVTGIDFFPALPDDIEQRVEAKVNPNAWSF